MIKKSTSSSSQLNLFKANFNQLLNMKHPLVLLADKIDWQKFDVALADCYSPDFGAPAKNIRLMTGLLYLKYAFNVSDEDLPVKWIENPYWQYFCGYEYMQHKLPLHYTTIIKWRQKAGEERLKILLEETINIAGAEGQLTEKDMASVNVDTTVQEKNITYPTDGKLYCTAINKLADYAKKLGINLRQPFVRVAKKLMVQVSRYAHARQYKRMKKALRKLRTYLGRLIRDIRRKLYFTDNRLEDLLVLCERLYNQQPTDKDKIYSLHEPDVKCISKGKAHKRYEFGNKVLVATSNKGNWILGCEAISKNKYDGHTLNQTIESVESLTGTEVKECFVDKGYRGHDYGGEADIHISGQGKKASWSLKRRKKRRSAIEPKIGHLKSENRMGRCFLKGIIGDKINAVLAGAGSNLRKLLKYFSSFFVSLLLLLNLRQNAAMAA